MRPFKKRSFGKPFGRSSFGKPSFEKKDFGPRKRFDDNERFDDGEGQPKRFGKSSRGESGRMHSATCAKCGEHCEIPFKPTQGKPVYCSNCFHKESYNDSRRETRGPSRGTASASLDEINAKLDKIMRALEID